MTDYDDNLTGAFFMESKSDVIQRGFLQINGEKKYAIIVESRNDKDEKKYEIFTSCGLIFYQDESEKRSSKSPDVGGRITIDEQKYKFGGWNKVSHTSGKEFTSCSLKPFLDEETKAPF